MNNDMPKQTRAAMLTAKRLISGAHMQAADSLDKGRKETAVQRAGGQIDPSRFLPNVPRQVHKRGGKAVAQMDPAMIPGFHAKHFASGGGAGFELWHGTPHEWAPEILVRHPEGHEERIKGEPGGALPQVPHGAELLEEHPHGKPDLSMIGAGEGAQAYGHGLYGAEGRGTAEYYKTKLSGATGAMPPDPRGFSVGNAYFQAPNGAKGPRLMSVAGTGEWKEISPGEYGEKLKVAQSEWSRKNEENNKKGHLYHLHADADPEHFLDWDKPLSEQPEVLKRIAPEGSKYPEDWLPSDLNITGAQYYASILGSPSHKSDFLSGKFSREIKMKNGDIINSPINIPGIRYRDAGSRGETGEPTHNYVFFSDKPLRVIGKYARGGAASTPNDTPAQNIADYVAQLLREGKEKEITNDLIAQADPQRLWHLYETGQTGMHMPMDLKSRLERAAEMGFTHSSYHGSGATEDISNLIPSSGGEIGPGVYHTQDPKIANQYAVRRDEEGDITGLGQVIPLAIKQPNEMNRKDWLAMRADLMNKIREDRGGEWSSDIPNIAHEQLAQKTGGNIYFQGIGADNQGAIVDPTNIRSQFARFDPRLAHLSHLNANTGGYMTAVALARKIAGGSNK